MTTNDKASGIPGTEEARSTDAPQLTETAQSRPPVSEIERKLMSAAEELGTWLGTAERKTSEFLEQQKVTDHLERIRDTAVRLLAQIEKGRERSR